MDGRTQEARSRIVRSTVGSDTGVITLFAAIGAFALAVVAWCWTRWIVSDHFRAVDPGADALPVWQFWALNALQVVGLIAALAFIWHYALKPRMATGRFTTEGLVCLALPTVWFQDLMFAYAQTWMSYNAHLWNLGSWAAEIPGWMAANPKAMLEPLVTFYGYIFWMFACMLVICAVLRRLRVRSPAISPAKLLFYGFLFTLVLDLLVEEGAIRLGWYAVPGAMRSVSLFAGTPYQLPVHEFFFGALQTLAFASILFYRDDRGYSFVERGAERLGVGKGATTGIRFLALTGALHLFFFITYSMPMQWVALHSDQWVDGMPSYFTAMCPEYETHRETCGGKGIPAYRPDYNWLP